MHIMQNGGGDNLHACACFCCRLVSSTDIIEMEWKGKKFNLTVRKSEALKAAEPVYQVSG